MLYKLDALSIRSGLSPMQYLIYIDSTISASSGTKMEEALIPRSASPATVSVTLFAGSPKTTEGPKRKSAKEAIMKDN